MFQLACCEEWGLDDDDVHVVTSYYYKGKVTGCYFKYKVSHWDWSPGTTATSEQELGYLDNVATTGEKMLNLLISWQSPVRWLVQVVAGWHCYKSSVCGEHVVNVNVRPLDTGDHWTQVPGNSQQQAATTQSWIFSRTLTTSTIMITMISPRGLWLRSIQTPYFWVYS